MNPLQAARCKNSRRQRALSAQKCRAPCHATKRHIPADFTIRAVCRIKQNHVKSHHTDPCMVAANIASGREGARHTARSSSGGRLVGTLWVPCVRRAYAAPISQARALRPRACSAHNAAPGCARLRQGEPVRVSAMQRGRPSPAVTSGSRTSAMRWSSPNSLLK